MTPAGVTASVVVAAYNEAATIADCVSSLLALQLHDGPVEIIVVDNGSTDGTREALAAFGERIRVLTETTRGASAARNCGVKAAQGRIVAFTDADCVVEPDWLAYLVAPLADPAVGVVGGRILSLPGANRIARYGEVIHDHHDAIEVQEEPYVISMNWASRREVLLDAGLFDEALLRGQDVDLSWRIRQAGYRLVYAPDAVVRHHNQHTVWGLAHEGYVHACHAVRVGRKHGHVFDVQGGLRRTRQRFAAGFRALSRGPRRVDGLLWLLFNTGKTAGEFSALLRDGRDKPLR